MAKHKLSAAFIRNIIKQGLSMVTAAAYASR
jgi:hypothetical protein